MPLAYAVHTQPDRSALAETLLRALDQSGGDATVKQIIQYLRVSLPEAAEKAVGYRQTPLVNSVGVDFALNHRNSVTH